MLTLVHNVSSRTMLNARPYRFRFTARCRAASKYDIRLRLTLLVLGIQLRRSRFRAAKQKFPRRQRQVLVYSASRALDSGPLAVIFKRDDAVATQPITPLDRDQIARTYAIH